MCPSQHDNESTLKEENMKHKKRLAIAGIAMAATLTLIGCGTPAGPSAGW